MILVFNGRRDDLEKVTREWTEQTVLSTDKFFRDNFIFYTEEEFAKLKEAKEEKQDADD